MSQVDAEHRGIFGGDSDEEDVQGTPAVPGAAPDADAGADDSDGAGDGDGAHAGDGLPSIPMREAGDDAKPTLTKKKPSKKKSTAVDEEAVADQEPDLQLTGTALVRAQVDAQIEAALKSGKRRQTRRRAAAGEDDLEMLADEEVSALRSDMIMAADEDEEANRYKQPAKAKLRLLPQVVSTLQK